MYFQNPDYPLYATHWYGSLFILMLGFQVYLAQRNVYVSMGVLAGVQIVGWLVYYLLICTDRRRLLRPSSILLSVAFNLLLVLTGAILPAVCAWIFDLTPFEFEGSWFWWLQILFYLIFVVLLQTPLYYFLGVFDLLWFFIFLGDRIYDETKTTVFYVIMWGFHYVVIIASEFGIQNLWITYGVYFVVWLVVLLIYGSLVSNNHHNFGYYIE
jgi:hypothetical protein